MATVYLGLGSNLGNREANLRMALRGLTRLARVKAVSSLYETDPIGPEQPPFLNAACRIEAGLDPLPLLRFLQALEHEIGRRPGASPQGPRPIDIDVLLYDDAVVDTEEIVIPHPRLHERAFVLAPLAEIADAVHPTLGTPIAAIAVNIGSEGVRKIADVGWDGVQGREGERVRI